MMRSPNFTGAFHHASISQARVGPAAPPGALATCVLEGLVVHCDVPGSRTRMQATFSGFPILITVFCKYKNITGCYIRCKVTMKNYKGNLSATASHIEGCVDKEFEADPARRQFRFFEQPDASSRFTTSLDEEVTNATIPHITRFNLGGIRTDSPAENVEFETTVRGLLADSMHNEVPPSPSSQFLVQNSLSQSAEYEPMTSGLQTPASVAALAPALIPTVHMRRTAVNPDAFFIVFFEPGSAVSVNISGFSGLCKVHVFLTGPEGPLKPPPLSTIVVDNTAMASLNRHGVQPILCRFERLPVGNVWQACDIHTTAEFLAFGSAELSPAASHCHRRFAFLAHTLPPAVPEEDANADGGAAPPGQPGLPLAAPIQAPQNRYIACFKGLAKVVVPALTSLEFWGLWERGFKTEKTVLTVVCIDANGLFPLTDNMSLPNDRDRSAIIADRRALEEIECIAQAARSNKETLKRHRAERLEPTDDDVQIVDDEADPTQADWLPAWAVGDCNDAGALKCSYVGLIAQADYGEMMKHCRTFLGEAQ
jgi:hypothetical protein